MNMSSALILIFLGSIGLYVSVFGLTVPGSGFILSGNLIKQDWDSIAGPLTYYPWSILGAGTCEIDPAGWLHLRPVQGAGAVGCSLDSNAVHLGSQFTVEYKVKIIAWGADTTNFGFCFYNGPIKVICVIYGTRAGVLNNAGTVVTKGLETKTGQVYQFTWLCDVPSQTTATIKLYVDGNLKLTWTDVLASGAGDYWFAMDGPSGNAEMRADYLYVDSGLVPPTVQPPPGQTGTVKVYASVNGQYVVAAVTANGISKGSTTSDVNSPLTLTLDPGDYAVTGTYNGQAPQSGGGTVHIVAGSESSPVMLNFGGQSPIPPTNGTGLLEQIKGFLADPTVKAGGTIGSLLFIGIGAIGLVPSKHRQPSPPPRYNNGY